MTGAGRGVRELWLSWLVYVPVLAVTVVTYWRLPVGATYHFTQTGAAGGISRTVVELNYPVAIGAIAMLAATAPWLRGWMRPVALAAGIGCLLVAIPGMVSQDDLTARYRNVPVALAAAVALGLVALVVWRAPARRWASPRLAGDPARIVIGVVLVVVSIPWIAAACGVFVTDIPVLGSIFRGSQPTPGEPGLASVHRGLHEGLAGMQLALTALILSRLLGLAAAGVARLALSLFLAVMLSYGVLVLLQDGWNEQLIKRGILTWDFPNVLTPQLNWGWFWVLAGAAAIHLGWFGRERARSSAAAGRTTAGRSS